MRQTLTFNNYSVQKKKKSSNINEIDIYKLLCLFCNES